MTNKSVSNPFNTGTGQKPPVFIGREVELKKFERNLRDTIAGRPRHLAIVGDEGAGKTVLLWEFIAKAAKDKVQPIYIQSYAVETFKDFYNLLLTKIVKVLPKHKVRDFAVQLGKAGLSLIGVDKIIPQIKEKDFEPQSALQEILGGMYKELETEKGGQAVIILIDDMHLIAQSLRQVLEILRNVFTTFGRNHYKIMLVVAGTPGLFPELERIHAAMARFFEPQLLQPLTLKEVEKAVTSPLKKMRILCDGEVIKQIYEISEGNPYYIQLLSYYSLERREKNRITRKSFQGGLGEALNHLATTQFENMYGKTSKEERKVLYALFKLGKESTFTTIVREANKIKVATKTSGVLIGRLKEKQLLRQLPNGEYDFLPKIFRLWLDAVKPFLNDGTI